MKKILTLCFVTALLAGCGTSSRVASRGESVDVGYGTQDKDKLTTSVSNLKVKKTEAQTYSSVYDYLRGRVPGVMVTSDNSSRKTRFISLVAVATDGIDDDYAVGTPHAVDGGRTVLDDIHGLDIRRIDAGKVRRFDTVHQDERVGGVGVRADTPDDDPVVRSHHHAGDAAPQVVINGAVGLGVGLLDLDIGDGAREFVFLLGSVADVDGIT